jgi:hypothetical protein
VSIHYHGTPITPRAQLLRMVGRHFCVSFAHPWDLKTCLQIGQSLMLDNGAFSSFTKGKQTVWADYYRWLAPVLAPPHWGVIPDVIDGSVDEQRELIRQWPHEEFGLLGAPVWHLGLSIDWLLELCDRWPRVCFGSAGEYWQVGSPKWAGRMDEAFNALHRSGRLTWIHGLRMLGQLDGGWPLASADSTNVAQNHSKRTGCAECMAAKIDTKQPALWWTKRPEQASLLELTP